MPLLRPDLSDLPAYQRPPEPPGGLRLHMNEAATDWPEAARKALLARLHDLPFNLYPERQGELTERLRQRLGVPAGGLLLGPSSGALLDLVAMAGLNARNEVAIPDPGFSLYHSWCGATAAVCAWFPRAPGSPWNPGSRPWTAGSSG